MTNAAAPYIFEVFLQPAAALPVQLFFFPAIASLAHFGYSVTLSFYDAVAAFVAPPKIEYFLRR